MPAATTTPAPVLALRVAGSIVGGTLAGLRGCWLPLLGLAALSFSIHHLLIERGADVALGNGPAGMALLVVAITVRLSLIAAMVLIAARHVRLDGRPLIAIDVAQYVTGRRLDPPRDPGLRDHVAAFMVALVPLALLYAGWQLVNDDLHQFLVRLVDAALADPEANRSNINFREGWKTYIPWTIGAWLLKVAFEKLRDRTGRQLLNVPVALAEVAWVVLTWLVLTSIIGRVRSWWGSREIVHWWREALGWLDDHLPSLSIPDVIHAATSAIGEVVSLVAVGLVLPLVWVGVAGLVLGWGIRESSTVAGTTWQSAAEQRWNSASRSRRYTLDVATRELREKYLPVLATGRLLWRSGVIPLLTIALLYTLGGLCGTWIEIGAANLVDSDGTMGGIGYETVERGVHFLLEPIRICFLAATFAEILRLRAERVPARDHAVSG